MSPLPRARVRAALDALGLGAAVSLLAVLLYRLWDASPRVPLQIDGDARLVSAIVKTVDERGWWTSTPRLGAPFGQELVDFPHGGETLQLGVVRLLAVVLDDHGAIMNTYYLLGFGALAAVTSLVVRRLGLGRATAAAVGALYALLPFHFAHGEEHLFRSTYLSVPLAVLLILWAVEPRRRFLRDPAGQFRLTNLHRRRLVSAAALIVVVGAWETMTTAFTMVLAVLAAALLAARRRDPAPLAAAGALVTGLFAVFALASMPTLLHLADEGTNPEAARRSVAESEIWALKPSRMVLPSPEHRLEALAELGAEPATQTVIPSEDGQALGLVATGGFLAAAGIVVLRGVRPWTGATATGGRLARLNERLGLMSLLALLVGTVSGGSMLLAIIGFSQIRVWNRLVTFIAFAGLVVAAVGFERIAPRLRRRRRLLPGAVLAGVVAVGILDQTALVVPDYDEVDHEVAVVDAHVAALEERYPPGSSVFQLPVVPFPEHPPVVDMIDYDHLQGYLASEHLAWSYGAVRGRPEAEWQERVEDLRTEEALRALVGLGFDALWVDRAGYEDRGAALEAELGDLLGVEPRLSGDGRISTWDLRPFREGLEATDAELAAEAEALLGVSPP